MPDARKTARNATYQRMPASHAAEDERAHRREDAPQAHAGGGDEAAERDHRQRRREQDVEELDAQEQREVPRSSKDRDRPERDGEVHEREHAGRRAEARGRGRPTAARSAGSAPTRARGAPCGRASPRRRGCRHRCRPGARARSRGASGASSPAEDTRRRRPLRQAVPEFPGSVIENDMASFAFIHGAGDVGWYWHLVEAELRDLGHDTVAPDLPIEDDTRGLTDYADGRCRCDPWSG